MCLRYLTNQHPQEPTALITNGINMELPLRVCRNLVDLKDDTQQLTTIFFASGPLLGRGAPQGGCELWLHKTLPFLHAQDHALAFAQLRPVISVADHCRLVMHLHGGTFSCSFVVLHAPCRSQMTSLQEIEEWWQTNLTLLHAAELAPLTWMFVDANALLASHACDPFGLRGQESTNEHGLLFEKFLIEGNWFAPTTMA